MKKLVIFLFLSITGLNIQVIGREPRNIVTSEPACMPAAQLGRFTESNLSLTVLPGCFHPFETLQQDTSKTMEEHTGKAVRDHDLEVQMNNDPDNRDRSIPNTAAEQDSSNVPEL